MAVTACSSTGPDAPVEQRQAVSPRATRPATGPAAAGRPALPASAADVEAAPVVLKPGEYMVKPGDTLTRIGLETGQGWRDIARWNNLENPNLIEVGQVLRVVPPSGEPQVSPVRPTRIETRPIEARPLEAGKPGAAPGAATAAAAAPAATGKPPAAEPAREVPREADEGGLRWSWPAGGSVLTAFDEKLSKGIAIAGKAGDPVVAAADGQVVYVGSGVRGYGNLIIVKHGGNFLTAYAHNQTFLVKEDQTVKRGQKIAEMGSSDTDRVKLHFEVRRQGKPVDPAKYLPAR
nr:peptidoglycan DD-metalloendopeptidase family protein [Ideonella livida]